MDFQIELRLFDRQVFSQASPICRACSSFDSLVERPTTIVLDCSEVAARKMPSHKSLAATTARRMDLPRFFGHGKRLREELLLNAPE